jgi:ligand-binding sensor domain-containing protein/signal transduction histidine kinase
LRNQRQLNRGIVVFLLTLVLGAFRFAGAWDVQSFNYTKRVWQIPDGLPENEVQAFAQTPDRFFWIGTTAGLVRFDGSATVVYDHRNTPELTEKSIFCLLATPDNSLWIGTEGGGLVLYRNGVFRRFSSADGLTNGFIRTVFQDHLGQIWIGTDDGLFRASGSRIVRVDGTANIATISVHAIAEDAHFGLWVGGSRLALIEQGREIVYQLPHELPEYRVKSILVGQDGTIWVGTVSGLYRADRLKPDADKTFERVTGVSGTARSLWQSPEGALWIGTIGEGVYVLDRNNLTTLRSPGWLPSNTVLEIFSDAEANIWVGTEHGMLRLSRTFVSTVALPGNADSDFGTIYQDTNHDLWMASSSLFRIRNGSASRYVFPQLNGARVRNVLRDSEGALWFGTDGDGAFRLLKNKLEHLTIREGLANNYIRVFLQSRDGSVWMATDGGVSRWSKGSLTSYQVKDGLCYPSGRSLLEDSNGDIWIGTDRGLSHMRAGAFLHDSVTEKLRDEKVWSIHQDPEGTLWFATRTNGLYRWKSGELAHFTVADGLVSDSIYQLIEDGRSNFWMSGPDGVSVVRRSELEQTAARPGHKFAVKLFGISQGLEMTEIYGGTQPSGIPTSDGVWFPSGSGPIHISTINSEKAKPPPVVIDEVLVDGQERSQNSLAASRVLLKPSSRKIQFNYTAVSLRSPEDIRFRYQLEGFDQDWTDSGTERQVYYTNLAPGTYQFRVVAFNMEDPSKTTEASVVIRQEPYFYRTPWFVFCCLLMVAGLVWISHLWRLHELRLRFHAVLEERGRVAREMHDTLIQGCVGVSTLLEGISSQTGAAEDGRSHLLDHARAQLRVTLDEARRALWHLRRDSTLTAEVGPLLGSLAEEIARETNVPISWQTSGKQFSIQAAQARELLMVTREALYNAVHHSEASTITLRIAFVRDTLGIQVSDDGKGFDSSLSAGPESGHYGLIGMRERVERMKGEFVLMSKSGGGTQLHLRIPCKPIYPPTGIEASR